MKFSSGLSKKTHTQRSGIIQAHEQQEKDAAHRSKRPEMKQKLNFPMLGKKTEISAQTP